MQNHKKMPRRVWFLAILQVVKVVAGWKDTRSFNDKFGHRIGLVRKCVSAAKNDRDESDQC